jgi:hypothetical protein
MFSATSIPRFRRLAGLGGISADLFLNPHLLEQSRASLSAIYFQQFTKAPPGSLLELSCAGLRLDKEHRVRP